MARPQARRDPEALFDRAHIGFNVVIDLETVAFQMADPLLAAPAVSVAVYVDGDQVGRLGQACGQQG
jgi:hypothetical protein